MWKLKNKNPSRSENSMVIELLFYYCYELTSVNSRVTLSSVSPLMSPRASFKEMNLLLLAQSRRGPEA